MSPLLGVLICAVLAFPCLVGVLDAVLGFVIWVPWRVEISILLRHCRVLLGCGERTEVAYDEDEDVEGHGDAPTCSCLGDPHVMLRCPCITGVFCPAVMSLHITMRHSCLSCSL